MNARPDDDALSWEGDDDPTLDTGVPASVSPARAPDAALPEAGTADPTAHAEPVPPAAPAATEPVARTPMGNTTLIAFGVLVGFYVLFTLGWVGGGLRLQAHLASTTVDYMLLGSFWLAALAPAIWFGTVFLLTRRSPGWVRILWLIAGVLLLVPWPFVMIGPVAQ